MQALTSGARTFCRRTSAHGFKHMAVQNRHWLERLLWLVTMTLAIFGMVDTCMGQLQRYMENPTVVTLEKDFRMWNYSLPAVTVCEQNRVRNDTLEATIKSLWNVEGSDPKYAYYAKFVAVVANSDLYHLQGYEQFKDDVTLDVDLHRLVLQVKPDMQVKTGSSEHNSPSWLPVLTEAGLCYTVNSVALTDVAIDMDPANYTTPTPLPYTCRYSAQGCYFVFESTNVVDYYLHSPYDIVNILSPSSNIFPTLNRFIELRPMETRAGRGVRDLPPQRRRCFYTDEPTDHKKQVYSTNTCKMSCRSHLSVQLCGCKPFYYHYEGFTDSEPMCSPAGMWCLAAHATRLGTFSGVSCPCSPQCLDSLYQEIFRDDHILTRGPFQHRGAIRFMVQPPRTRYTREIVFHFQDLVVSFGGAAGLFLGASFISFIEILYFILERLFSTNTNTTDQKHNNSDAPRPYRNRLRQLSHILEEVPNNNRFNELPF